MKVKNGKKIKGEKNKGVRKMSGEYRKLLKDTGTLSKLKAGTSIFVYRLQES